MRSDARDARTDDRYARNEKRNRKKDLESTSLSTARDVDGAEKYMPRPMALSSARSREFAIGDDDEEEGDAKAQAQPTTLKRCFSQLQ
ncbi:uncharacterized protein MEPE_02192 [Melanopsichium pennsylvanicum]|uniref:Uncharacterized protein n=1 Tax=Melanopsichium pennsylvanicum TaxID=63383 RepID=A0AAJ4XJV1_9BASI|nr:uncharacterized protein MEPE_02192 [Melanopsichium pennsylvanicum]